MKIVDYIIRGGENLNSSPLKTSTFPFEAESIFNNWYPKLGKDDKEKENYFELPVNAKYRLFIRVFYIEKPGNRPICFYIGILVPKEAYIEAKDYYCLHKGLCNVAFAQIQKAADSFVPLDITIDWPVPRSSIGLDFQQLSKIRLYGEKDFSSNINQMCFSISINNINDWFERLFIAVNPYRLNDSFNIIISRVQPRPIIPNQEPNFSTPVQSPLKTIYEPKTVIKTIKVQEPQKHMPCNHNKLRWIILPIILFFSICLNIFQFLITQDKIPIAKYYKLEDEYKSLENKNNELSQKCTNLEYEKIMIENNYKKLKEENENNQIKINQLQKEIKEQKKIIENTTRPTIYPPFFIPY